jgi:aspartyl-tRNA(Asn)/glutamyl-tRNA(Gln) amidotransferase subunit A
MEITHNTITTNRKLIADGKISARELIDAHITRIQARDADLHAFLALLDSPYIDSSKIDKPLYGIPFSMKDVYMTEGIETTAGSSILRKQEASYDATVYTKLKDAGAVLIGKTNCDPFGHGSSTENSDFGPSKNPWNTEYVPGGSSGGDGVAVAAGMSGFGIAEDTGGSIRMPASFCGVVGLKVTYGRVSRYGSIAYGSSLDTVGPMTRSVDDCALVMETIAGPDFFDANTYQQSPPAYTKCLDIDLKGLTIGIPTEYFGEGIDEEVQQKVMEAVSVLEKKGARVKQVSLPKTSYAISVYYLIATSETSSNLSRFDGIRYGHPRSAFGAEAKRRIMLGTYALSSGYYDAFYQKATKIRTLIKQDIGDVLNDVDVLIGPASPTPPFKIGEKADPMSMYMADILTVSTNLAGIPSLVVPAGMSKKGLPIGMQIMGKHFAEDQLLAIGHQYEQEIGGFPLIDL